MPTRDIESAPVAPQPAAPPPERRPRPKAPRGPGRPVKILFVSADAGPHLALDAEYRAIEQGIRAARYRDAFLLIPKLAARLSDLQQALLEHSPDIVHFSCHGSDRAELVLLGEEAASAPVPTGALSAMFRVLRDNVTLVVFNACFASAQAEEVRRTVGLAIGMRERIEDSAAIAFSASLYGALAYGRSVGEAFELARAALASASPNVPDLPQLFAEDGLDPDAVHLVDTRPRPRHRLAIAAAAAAACASLGLAWWLLRHDGPSSDDRRELLPPRPGMARFAGGSIRPGWFAASRRPQECAALRAEEDCAELDPSGPSGQIAEVRIDPFDLDSLEVTNRDYAAWLNAQAEMWQVIEGSILLRQTPPIPLVYTSDECGGGLSLVGDRVHAAADKASRPAVCVTWYGASEYCRAQGKRLPLEMEWELAAKGSEGRPFPWGDALPKHDGVTFDRREGGAKHPRDVGTSPQDVSPEGVRDLGGNVAEWVEGRNLDDKKTFRGGSWASRGPCHLLGSGCAHRRADLNANDVGFRCASSVIARSP